MGGEMPTIYVAQTPHLPFIFRKEQGGVGTFGRILVKKTVHASVHRERYRMGCAGSPADWPSKEQQQFLSLQYRQ
jgi:hypothetical protein